MGDESKSSTGKKDDGWNKDPKDRGSGLREGEPLLKQITGRQMRFSLWYFLIVLVLLLIANHLMEQRHPVEPIEFSAFKHKVTTGEIKRVEIGSRELLGFSMTRKEMKQSVKAAQKGGKETEPKVYRAVPVTDETFVPLLDQKGVEYYGKVEEQSFLSNFVFTWVLPIAFMMLIWGLIFRRVGKMGAGVMSFGGNRAQLVAEGEIDVRFDDVAGVDEAKEELQEVVDFLKTPERYTAVGGKIPKGILLVGPPGTGKTLCARAVAGEAAVPFFKMSGADFVEMFVGVGAARVRDLFKQAREKSPCIIFIDELDAIGKARGSMTVGGHDEREQTLNQLLVEMDGFDSRSGVIILAATNRPEILDPALLRPGRFDRQILVDRPDLKGREAILERHVRHVKVHGEVSLRDIAALTPGFAGADLENLVNEAALLAVRRGLEAVGQKEFEDAIEKLVAGLEKKNRLLNKKEREIVAHHEAGHAIIAAFTPGADPVKKVSIVPRGLGALGYTMQTPVEDRFLLSESELLGKIDVLLGGRAAEHVIFNEISTGAANDLDKATETARKMVTEYGMSEKFRNMALHPARTSAFLGGPPVPGTPREYSEETQRYIDETVAKVLHDRYDMVVKKLEEKRSLLEKIAHALLERESINQETFERLIA